ncbi:MAG: DUF5666 domain-containing protein [Patescibacteria group bacterium]|jgi:hypothetical protein
MSKFNRIVTSLVLSVAVLAPGVTLASNVDFRGNTSSDIRGEERGVGLGFFTKVWSHDRGDTENPSEQKRMAVVTGTITAVSSTGFSMKTKDGETMTVLTTNAELRRAFGSVIVLADLAVNDNVWVKGAQSASTITAKVVYDLPANTHPAIARGTVTAISGNTLTVAMEHLGIPTKVTVTTDAGTSFYENKDKQASGSFADITVGAKVAVKGLWDEVRNLLEAIQVRIR